MSITINVHKKLHIIDNFVDKLVDDTNEKNTEDNTTKYFNCFDEGSINNAIPAENPMPSISINVDETIDSYNEMTTSYAFNNMIIENNSHFVKLKNDNMDQYNYSKEDNPIVKSEKRQRTSGEFDLQNSYIYNRQYTNLEASEIDQSSVKYLDINICEVKQKKYKRKRLGNIVFSVLLNIGGNWFD